MNVLRRPVLWTVDELAEKLGAARLGGAAGAATVCRFITAAASVKPGDVYVPLLAPLAALPGNISRAMANGAVAVVVAGQHRFEDFPLLEVSNLRGALEELAKDARAAFRGRVIGVTGSVGKTSTKDMLAHILAHDGITHFTDANLNSTESNLASVASLPSDAEFSVLELAMTDPRSIRRKSLVARPDVAVLTAIGSSHGSHHADDPESILKTKTDIFFHLSGEGVAVLPSQDKNLERILARARESGKVKQVITCGELADDTVRLVGCVAHATYSEVAIEVEGRTFEYVIPQPGAHFVYNSLLAAGAMFAVGAPLRRMAALSTFATTRRRVERFRVPFRDGAIELIDDGYNAAPESVRALLSILKGRPRARRRVLVFGDMLELGGDAESHHNSLALEIDNSNIDLLVTVGPSTEMLAKRLRTRSVSFPDSAAAARKVGELIRSGDLVAVKGSNAMKLIRVVNALKGSSVLERRGRYWAIESDGG